MKSNYNPNLRIHLRANPNAPNPYLWHSDVICRLGLHFMKLSIYSLKKILFAGEASLLNCKTTMGEITVLDKHETYIGKLTTGVMKVVDAQKQDHFFEITSGFLEVRQGNEVRCLVE